MPAHPEETDLIMRLYADADGAGDWNGVCERLVALTRAAAAALIVPEARGALDQSALPVELATMLLAPDDPCGLRRMRPERVYAAADLPGGGTQTAPWQIRALAMRLSGRDMVWLVLVRQGADFRAADGALLSTLAPHLPQAVALWQRTARARARAVLQADLGARLGARWLAFDADGRLCDHAPGTAKQLHRVARMRPGQRLEPTDAEVGARLDAALRRVMVEGALSEAVALGRPPAPALVLQPAPPEMAALGASVIGWVRTPPAGAPRPELVAQLLGVPVSEARLALALAQGATLREAAAALGVTEETARSYSRQIFARTGLRGQPDLVRALLNSPLWLEARPKQG